LLLPDLMDGSGTLRHLAVASGKANPAIYVVDRDNMGKFTNPDAIYQEFNALPPPPMGQGEFAKPSYFNSTVYSGGVGDRLKAFSIVNTRLSTTPSSQSAATFTYASTTNSISTNCANTVIART